jgi:hypothetical protein
MLDTSLICLIPLIIAWAFGCILFVSFTKRCVLMAAKPPKGSSCDAAGRWYIATVWIGGAFAVWLFATSWIFPAVASFCGLGFLVPAYGKVFLIILIFLVAVCVIAMLAGGGADKSLREKGDKPAPHNEGRDI